MNGPYYPALQPGTQPTYHGSVGNRLTMQFVTVCAHAHRSRERAMRCARRMLKRLVERKIDEELSKRRKHG